MEQTRRALLAAGVAAGLSSRAVAAAYAESAVAMSPAAQREDLAIVRQVLEESHVGLEWYLDKASFSTQFDTLSRTAVAPASITAFQLRLTRFVASLGHGHTTLEAPPTGAGYWLRRIPTRGSAMPLGVRLIAGRLFVAHDLSPRADVGSGTEILGVDEIAAADLVSAMESLLSADGRSQSSRHYQIGQGWRFQDLLCLLGQGRDRHRLRLRRLDGRIAEMTLPVATPEEIMQRFEERRGRALDRFGPAVTYERRGPDGVLTVRSFYEGILGPGSPGFAHEFALAFEQIRTAQPRRLVLDLRANEGGNNDHVPRLYAYLTDRPFRFTGPTIVRSATISGLRYMDDPSDDLRAFSVDPAKFVLADPTFGWILKPEYAGTMDFTPEPTAYLGPLTVLTDGGSFSATAGILDLIHRYHRREGRQVTFLGEAPGVDTRLGWSTGGQSLLVNLPNSRLRLAVPLLGAPKHFSTSSTPVTLPDRILTPSPVELVHEIDGVLTRALV